MLLDDLDRLLDFYERQLADCIAFWLRYGRDREYGGFLTFLDRQGQPYSFWKYTWCQGRATYQFAKLYNVLEKRPDYLAASRSGAEFLWNHVLKEDHRVYSKLTRNGDPVAWAPGAIFCEAFVILGLAEFSRAGGEQRYLAKARDLFWNSVNLLDSGALGAASGEVRPYYKCHAPAMILLNVAQELREVQPDARRAGLIDKWMHDELYVYARDDQHAMFERLLLDDSPDLTTHEGRSLTPGHAMESMGFCLREGLARGDSTIIERASTIMEWTMEKGWDTRFGGLFNFVDYHGGPHGHHDEGWGEDQDWDAKLFWPHAEALYALLLAWSASQRPAIRAWYEKVHEWTFGHFPDPAFGEWFGYLHRDGAPSQTLKGGVKGFFHVPRALLNAVLLLRTMRQKPLKTHGPC